MTSERELRNSIAMAGIRAAACIASGDEQAARAYLDAAAQMVRSLGKVLLDEAEQRRREGEQ
jgi:hypothetical protein